MRAVLRGATIVAGLAVVACFELSGPPASLLAISTMRPAWPSVVVGDVLRDEEGVEAPLRIEAFDSQGNPVTDVTVSYIMLDRGLHADAAGLVYGDSVRSSPARIVAQVRRGSEVIQTPELSVAVVPRPDSVAPAGFDTLDVKTHTLSRLTDTAQVTSEPLTITLRNRARLASNAEPATVRSWIVRYEITSAPEPAVTGAKTAFFAGTATQTVAVDTTDNNGAASRAVVLRTSVLGGSRTGTHRVKVTVTVRERGQNVPGSPVEIVVPFDIRPAP